MRKKACYDLLTVSCGKVIELLECSKRAPYFTEIANLAKEISNLIKEGISLDSVISFLTISLEAIHKAKIEKINTKIQNLFNKRKQVFLQTVHGEQLITDLTVQIAALEMDLKNWQEIRIQEIIQDVLKELSGYTDIKVPSTPLFTQELNKSSRV